MTRAKKDLFFSFFQKIFVAAKRMRTDNEIAEANQQDE
jgi:hypothetical protein